MTITTTPNQLADVETLSAECVEFKPVEYEFYGITGDRAHPDDWVVLLGSVEHEWNGAFCSRCGADEASSFAIEPCDAHDEIQSSVYYPVPKWCPSTRPEGGRVPTDCMLDKISGLNLALVAFDDGERYGLALTGSGMDFTWEIAEAYMRLGFLPPFHFCDLPHMADKPNASRGIRESIAERYGCSYVAQCDWIVSGCRRTCEVLKRFADLRLAKLVELAPVRPRGCA